MMKIALLSSLMALLLTISGCGSGTPVSVNNAVPPTDSSPDKKSTGHGSAGHSHVAPHGGLVNSIGSYHVELVYDMAASKLVFYILGEDENSPSAIEAKPIPGQFKAEGTSDFIAFSLIPAPQTGDKPDTASRFEAAVSGMEKGKAYEIFIRPTIEDKAYRTAYQLTPGKTTTAAKSFICPMAVEHPKQFPKPGKCPLCQMVLVEIKDGKIEHSEHSPKHGGSFFMASDNWHHLEGVLVSATEFRLYLYDNFTKPMSAKGYEGTAEVVRQDSKGADLGKTLKIDLQLNADANYLTAAIPPEYIAPLAFTVRVTLQKGEKPSLFNFTFEKPSFKH